MLFVLLAGCSPLTAYRQSLLVDPPAPPMAMGAPVGPDTVTLGAYASGRALSTTPELLPEEGDPGVFVPATALGASARVGLGRSVEIGGHVDYAAAEWATASSVGVLPLADGAPVWGAGAHLTVGHRYARVGWGATVDATWLSLPYARYAYVGPPAWSDGGYVAAGDAAELYALEASGAVHPIRIRATGAVTIPVGLVDLSPGLSLTPTFTNEGFTDVPARPFQAGPLSLIPVLDVGVWVEPARIGLQVWAATGAAAPTDGRDLGFGGRLALEWVPGAMPERRPAPKATAGGTVSAPTPG